MAESANLRVVVVDDNDDARYALVRMLHHRGYDAHEIKGGENAVQQIRLIRPDVVLLDVMMPIVDGYQVTADLKSDPELRFIPVILVTAKDSLSDVVDGLDRGADGYIAKPFQAEELLARLRAAARLKQIYDELRSTKAHNTALIQELSESADTQAMIGESAPMKEIFGLLDKIAPANSPVLITGASGTGKELIARAIHQRSARRERPFVAKNCAAFNENLLEAELFGSIKGAYTGAVRDQKGVFEIADGGTLFLDEIGEMSPTLQAKLLRVLQEGTFSPVGSHQERKVDVRVLAATHRDLEAMVKEQKFREDLYYRLNVLALNLPRLSERREDIPLLLQYYVTQLCAAQGHRTAKGYDADVSDCFLKYTWPGNIRELRNEVERMVILSGDAPVLTKDLISQRIRKTVGEGATASAEAASGSGQAKSLKEEMEGLERNLIQKALAQCNGNRSNAAKILGISRSNLIAKIQAYGLQGDA